MAEAIKNNCHFCSDEIADGEPIVRKVDVWRDDEEGVMPVLVATGQVAHRSCAAERAVNEDEIERFKSQIRELTKTRTVVILTDEPEPSAEIPGQETLFDGKP